MKAPDKICVAPHQIFDYDLEIQEVGHNGAEEYIRKDALIELIEEQLAILDKQTLLHPDDDMFWGQKNAYKQMKDKLNSL